MLMRWHDIQSYANVNTRIDKIKPRVYVLTIRHGRATMSAEVYSPTTEFNGKVASRRRQRLVVVEGRRIKHGPLFPNTQIIGRVTLEGTRGARYDGFVYASGLITVLN
jgi:hypothetical protein